MIYVLALGGVVLLGVGSWWASVWAWESRPEDDNVAPEVPRHLDELRRRAVTRERIP